MWAGIQSEFCRTTVDKKKVQHLAGNPLGRGDVHPADRLNQIPLGRQLFLDSMGFFPQIPGPSIGPAQRVGQLGSRLKQTLVNHGVSASQKTHCLMNLVYSPEHELSSLAVGLKTLVKKHVGENRRDTRQNVVALSFPGGLAHVAFQQGTSYRNVTSHKRPAIESRKNFRMGKLLPDRSGFIRTFHARPRVSRSRRLRRSPGGETPRFRAQRRNSARFPAPVFRMARAVYRLTSPTVRLKSVAICR